jgi:signal transduction histidine kinase
VCIEITDEGPGIPPADRERIWRPYQRGSDVGGVAGSGVGLSVVHDVVVQHGGRAWVEDAPEGRGARFVVTLPASSVAPIPARQPAGEADEQVVEGSAPPHPRTPAPARQ